MTAISHSISIPEEQAGRRLDQALAELLPDYSRSRIKEWILGGCVLLDGAVAQPRTLVAAGQQVELQATVAARAAVVAQDVPFEVVHEDDAVLVVLKPAGLVVHPGAGNPDATLENGLRRHAPALAALPRSGLLHRLDKDTSGLVLVAKTLAAHTHLTRALQEREITREYRAIVNGVMTAGGTVEAPIGRHPTQRTRMAVVGSGRPAVTHYRVLGRFAAHSFIAVRLETGRTHQIRVHMAHIGFPILGDPTYGGRPRLPAGADAALIAALQGFRRQALHASAIRFRHPASGEWLEFGAPLPQDMRAALAALAGSAATAQRLEALPWPKAL
ncbi:MAG: pseudouridine synthase [Gammaproteobacteria bacterium]|nr:MAG: 23S rRNA pseudouridine(1911/1915/1917) synthase RluD [Pseudomonadota bacterium]MBC6944691.1 23S rRNA pseudouridine(1911/1915/1917) synthase RluD [Gammaproteobacteria bacterium]MCE7896702.1 23S rRNA pseudouridine(1911/1915/1917) synthase RluD [Gammaproteobacteria bacterium PRO8]MDL1881164.1 23S rRNA pseudouridine(1911/1915/1917) synthase RluD [Gammaproteobacteria bacterium PRO2]MCL4778497.1 23S rRNA pseudouridine(1911/1915/1917) synthase RluD [Gammaproteobacteria bacterium]